MLLEVSEKANVLVACGGGTPCFGDNMSLMNSRGITVLLQTSHERLFERLKRGRHKRPLIAALTDEQLDVFIEEQLENVCLTTANQLKSLIPLCSKMKTR